MRLRMDAARTLFESEQQKVVANGREPRVESGFYQEPRSCTGAGRLTGSQKKCGCGR